LNPDAALKVVAEEVCACRKCPRLVKYREKVAREKRRSSCSAAGCADVMLRAPVCRIRVVTYSPTDGPCLKP